MSKSTSQTEYLPALPTPTSIRLVSLNVGSGQDSEIALSLKTCDLLDRPRYAALSYTWGEPLTYPYTAVLPTKPITIDGHDILVTQNLYDALNHLRGWKLELVDLPGEHTPFWVDALCINQSDIAERNHQVAMMGKIYAKADMVFTWAGKHNEDAKAAIMFVYRLKPVIELWRSDENAFAYSYDSDDLYERADISPPTPEEWTALHQLFERQLFKRVWVVQEVSLARGAVLMVGHYFVNWDDLRGLASMMARNGWIPALAAFLQLDKQPAHSGDTRLGIGAPGIYYGIRYCCEQYWKAYGQGQTRAVASSFIVQDAYALFEHSLYETRWFRATDPRDMVYAVLSLVSYACEAVASAASWMRPDYALPVGDVYIEVTERIITNTGSVSILSQVDSDSKSRLGLPSWVPDYSSSEIEAVASFGRTTLRRGLSPCGRTCDAIIRDNVLSLSALKYDEIVDLASQDSAYGLQGPLELCLRLPEIYANGQIRSEALWRTLAAETNGYVSPVPDDLGLSFRAFVLVSIAGRAISVLEERGSGTHELHDFVSLVKLNPADSDSPDPWLPRPEEIEPFGNTVMLLRYKDDAKLKRLEQPSRTYFAAYKSVMAGRRLFRTSTNLLGLGPQSIKPGDSIWFVPSSRVPFVLRRHGPGRYQLVGEGYLHGYMQDETQKLRGPLQRIAIQ